VLSNALYGFLVVFAVIGGLEFVDRTSFALIAIAARSRAGPAWAGGASAFALTTGIAVLAGTALATVLGPHHIVWLRVGGGSFLIGYAVWSYLGKTEKTIEAKEEGRSSAFLAAFLTIFLLELGDTTQIFEIVFVTDYGWLVVLLGGALGLATVAAWDVGIGRYLGARVAPERLRAVVTVVMIVVGALTIVYGLAPTFFAFS